MVHSQLFVALCGTALAVFFMVEQEMLRWPTVALIFITFWSGYLYTKFQGHRNFRKVLVFNFISALISAALIFANHNEIRLLKWLCIVILGLLYNSRFLDSFVRRIPLIKVFYVGLTWALINAWLILPEFNQPIFWISLLFVSALVLPFDIRDMHQDDVVTFPKVIGVTNTKYLAYILLFAATSIAIHYLKQDFSGAFTVAVAVTYLLIYFADADKPDSYFSFSTELCSAVPLLALILIQFF